MAIGLKSEGISPVCTALNSKPAARLAAAGKSRKSSSLEPTKTNGLIRARLSNYLDRQPAWQPFLLPRDRDSC